MYTWNILQFFNQFYLNKVENSTTKQKLQCKYTEQWSSCQEIGESAGILRACTSKSGSYYSAPAECYAVI